MQSFIAMGMLGLDEPPPKGFEDHQTMVEEMAGPLTEYTQFNEMFGTEAPRYEINRKDIEIDGVDGNKIPLSIYQGTSKTLYYYIHGGGMSTLSSRYEPYKLMLNHWNGKHGMTVVAVDFRNYMHHPDENIKPAQFPAGLNDCYSGLEWANEHKAELGCETIVVFGESGGGNLSLTTTLKTLKEGKPEMLDGTFAMCPYTTHEVYSDRYPSIAQNDGYGLHLRSAPGRQNMYMYTAKVEDRKNPLAWPMMATEEDVKGMKPVVISVNEMDPLKDQGLEFYRKLLKAGVKAQATIVGGTMHSVDVCSPYDAPAHFDSTTNAIKSFAAGLRGKVLVEADAPAPKPAVQEEKSEAVAEATSESAEAGDVAAAATEAEVTETEVTSIEN